MKEFVRDDRKASRFNYLELGWYVYSPGKIKMRIYVKMRKQKITLIHRQKASNNINNLILNVNNI